MGGGGEEGREKKREREEGVHAEREEREGRDRERDSERRKKRELTCLFSSCSQENEDGVDNLPVVEYESTVDNSVIIYLVERGSNVNMADIYGSTPLHFAAMRGNEVACRELMDCKSINIEVGVGK